MNNFFIFLVLLSFSPFLTHASTSESYESSVFSLVSGEKDCFQEMSISIKEESDGEGKRLTLTRELPLPKPDEQKPKIEFYRLNGAPKEFRVGNYRFNGERHYGFIQSTTTFDAQSFELYEKKEFCKMPLGLVVTSCFDHSSSSLVKNQAGDLVYTETSFTKDYSKECTYTPRNSN